jgi:hypothetical protein
LIDGDILAVQERTGRQLFARQEPAVEIEPDAKMGKLTGEFFYSVVGFSAERELSRKKIDELGTGAHVRVDTWKESPWILPVEDERAGDRRGKALGPEETRLAHRMLSAMSTRYCGQSFVMHGVAEI